MVGPPSDRPGPRRERAVGVLSTLVQLGFVGGAAVAVFLASTRLPAASALLVGANAAPGLAVALGLLVVVVLLAVRGGKLPQRAPANRPHLHAAAAVRASDVTQ